MTSLAGKAVPESDAAGGWEDNVKWNHALKACSMIQSQLENVPLTYNFSVPLPLNMVVQYMHVEIWQWWCHTHTLCACIILYN